MQKGRKKEEMKVQNSVKKNYKTINSSHMMDDLDLISLLRTGKEEGGGEEGGHTSELPFGIY